MHPHCATEKTPRKTSAGIAAVWPSPKSSEYEARLPTSTATFGLQLHAAEFSGLNREDKMVGEPGIVRSQVGRSDSIDWTVLNAVFLFIYLFFD
jgi:hypothetical protein